jgi:hypothetical protein
MAQPEILKVIKRLIRGQDPLSYSNTRNYAPLGESTRRPGRTQRIKPLVIKPRRMRKIKAIKRGTKL